MHRSPLLDPDEVWHIFTIGCYFCLWLLLTDSLLFRLRSPKVSLVINKPKGVFPVRIFPHSDWIYPYQSVFSSNAGKYGPEKTPNTDTFHAVKVLLLLFSKGTITKRLLLGRFSTEDIYSSEAALQRCSWEKVFWKYTANV